MTTSADSPRPERDPGRPGRRRRSRPPRARRGLARRDRPLRRRRLRRRRRRARGVRRRGGRGRRDLHHQGGLRPGRGGRGAHRQRRAGPRQGPALGVSKNLQAGQGPVAAVQGAVEQFVTIFTTMGGLMAERVTDLRDIERRVVAHLVGEPAPGVPTPSEPSILVAEDLAPSDTVGPRPRAGHRPGHRARRRDQPHRDHRPAARHPVRGRRRRRHGRPGRGPSWSSTARPAPSSRAPTPTRRAPGSQESRASARSSPRWNGPAATADGTAAEAARQRRRRRLRRVRGRRARAGRGPLPHRAVLPRPEGGAERRGAGRHLLRRSSRPTPTAATSSYAPSTPAPTSRSRSRPTRARRTRRSACAACG